MDELTPEQKARQDAEDKDCNLAKREHKWVWLWDDKKWTEDRKCTKCGKVEFNVKRNYDEQA